MHRIFISANYFHNILIIKLDKCGCITGHSWLENHIQRVLINDSTEEISSRVLQDWSWVLVIIFIHDLGEDVEEIIIKYTDM